MVNFSVSAQHESQVVHKSTLMAENGFFGPIKAVQKRGAAVPTETVNKSIHSAAEHR